MRSTKQVPKTIDEYLASVNADHRDALQKIREVIHAVAPNGEESACGWLKDKFGLSWQVTPTVLIDMLHDEDSAKAERAMKAMLQMQKIDIDKLKAAYEGK